LSIAEKPFKLISCSFGHRGSNAKSLKDRDEKAAKANVEFELGRGASYFSPFLERSLLPALQLGTFSLIALRLR